MAIHHLALATTDLARSHRFYTEAMGFRLVDAQAGVTDEPSGESWARHVFYDTGGGTLLALWDLHDARVSSFDASLSRGLGLPTWVNHIAFAAADLEALDAARERWLDHGLDVLAVDHGRTRSIYTDNPDGTMVEWCCTMRDLTDDDARAAVALIDLVDPPLMPLTADVSFFSAADHMPARSPM